MIYELSVNHNTKWICILFVSIVTTTIMLYTFQDSAIRKDKGILKAYRMPNYFTRLTSGARTTIEAQPQKSDATAPNLLYAESLHSNDDFFFDVINSSILVNYSSDAVIHEAGAIHARAREYVQLDPGPCEKRLPQCLIIGNFKCGTKELLDLMSMHPRIIIKTRPQYETKFFSHDYKYAKGLFWYKNQMPCSYKNQIIIEKSPEYFQRPKCASRIHAMNSTIKLIVMVREPVSRTVSHFTFFNNYTLLKLEDSVINKTTGEILKIKSAIQCSIYDEGMENYLNFFDRSQIKLIDSEDFKRDPYTVLRDLETFLNLEHTIGRDNFVFNEEKGLFCLRQNRTSETASCYSSRRGRNITDFKKLATDTPQVYRKLEDYFRPHNERFFKLAGRVFDW